MNSSDVSPPVASGRRAASTSRARKAKTAAARTGTSSTESKLGGARGRPVGRGRLWGKPWENDGKTMIKLW